MEETATKNFAIVSRDEMNLAEFPLAVLSTRGSSTVKTLEFQDSVKGKNGELVNRQWIITGADKFGLPTSSDDEVLLGLLKLSVDDGFRSQKVYFTRYELLRALRWTTEGRNYQRLQKALDRLSGVRIKATNAFYDNVAKAHSTVNFGIIDGYEINDGRDSAEQGKTSFFIWSETLFKSFQVGFIKKLDLDFYLGLKSAVSKRLYRYLDKHFWYRSKVQNPVFVLAHEKIGISRNFKYVSAVRQQLDPALDELAAAGFVERYEYIGKGSDTQVVIFAALGKPRVDSPNTSSAEVSASARPLAHPSPSERTPEPSLGLVSELTLRGIKEPQAQQLVSGIQEDELVLVRDILRYFDFLIKTRSKLVSISPAGFLYKAIKERSTFVLPEHVRTVVKKPQPKPASASLEAEYLEMRKREILRIRHDVEPGVLTKMAAELERKLQAVRKALSPEGFRDAVEHGVNEQLARLYNLPEFEVWVKTRQSSVRSRAVSS